ncbi:MAG: DUF4159 domain-containing protein [Rhizomicrobium sp.]
MNWAAISFSSPWILTALILLPAIWFLLRVIPPLPKRAVFPPIKLLAGLNSAEETPAGTPWWLMLLRLLLAAAVIIALAGPQIGRNLTLAGRGPLVLIIDNGWTAAANWDAHQGLAREAVRLAEDQNRPVMILPTAEAPDTSLVDAGRARRRIEALKPQAWLADRGGVIAALKKAHLHGAEILWLSDGVDDGASRTLARLLKAGGHSHIFRDPPTAVPMAITALAAGSDGWQASLLRAGTEGKRRGLIALYGHDGEQLATAPYAFADGTNRTTVRLNLPLAMRSRAARLQIEGYQSTGAVYLFDRGAPRRAVGITVSSAANDEPLLSGQYYLERALHPYADTVSGPLGSVLRQKPSVLILADGRRLSGSELGEVQDFVTSGGLLIRFAGDRLAEGGDDMTPVPLRSGGRYLSGPLSWTAPQHLAPFAATSPFAGLPLPAEVTVSRQILAEPSVDLASHSWAQLADGTPMVTAAPRGKGWIVLFHVTAGPSWSNLPLSGLYVDMLRRLLPLATGVHPAAMAGAAALPPVQTLTGFGHLHHAGAEVQPVKALDIDHIEPDRHHPPGLYGPSGAERALNPTRENTALLPIGRIGIGQSAYAERASFDLAPPLLLAAAALLLIDMLAGLWLRGLFEPRKLFGAVKALLPLILIAALLPPPAHGAGQNDSFAQKAALDTRLGYIVTGAADTDTMSKAGLTGLGHALAMRTAYNPPEPMAVNPETDDLSFFPLLYWPMDPRERDLSPKALARLSDYMRNGGTLLIDTRDQTLPPGIGQHTLRRLLGRIDLPPLQPVGTNHVLTRTFYLLSEFPGRWSGGKVWIAENSAGDGVSPVIIGSADWAAAWAVDHNGRPVADVAPGGERQREMAIRFGINVAMYALTGNYKTDQIHVPTILKRLGH